MPLVYTRWARPRPTLRVYLARAIQQSYRSWSEVSTGYLLGWRYWQHGKPTERFYIEQAEWLKTNPTSPWQQLAWDTPLG